MNAQTSQPNPAAEQRRHPRVTLPVGYAPVRVHVGHDTTAINEGHAYDLSLSGVRFELDDALAPNELVILELHLPGRTGRTIRAAGHVVRRHDPDEVGPVRMAVEFDRFPDSEDQDAVRDYVARALASAN